MTEAAPQNLLKRDRAIVAAALAALAALAWTYLLWLARSMASSAPVAFMPGMAGMNMGPAPHPWGIAEFAFTFAMWTVMMAGMMTPSAAPMILLYARIGRQARAQGHPFAATGWFAGGYLLAWTAFAAFASLAQAALSQATSSRRC